MGSQQQWKTNREPRSFLSLSPERKLTCEKAWWVGSSDDSIIMKWLPEFILTIRARYSNGLAFESKWQERGFISNAETKRMKELLAYGWAWEIWKWTFSWSNNNNKFNCPLCRKISQLELSLNLKSHSNSFTAQASLWPSIWVDIYGYQEQILAWCLLCVIERSLDWSKCKILLLHQQIGAWLI